VKYAKHEEKNKIEERNGAQTRAWASFNFQK
jgi:hypothetical protein